MVLLAPGISILDKAFTHRTLLTCGANILQINAVRKHISQMKGGRLAQMLPSGATLINLTRDK
jgi:hydroxypyruvate reductase/glycerate 2-kinase